MILIFLIFSMIFFLKNSEKYINQLKVYFTTVTSTVEIEEVEKVKKVHIKSNIVVNGPLMTLEVEKEGVDISGVIEVASTEDILVDIPILDGEEEDHLAKPKKAIHLDIIKTANARAFKDVEKRFRSSHDTEDSLFLARTYYDKGQYEQSEFWALETNKISPNIEESMFIFVKSKMKLGRKDEARNILTGYLKKSNSPKARNLLLRIENNKF
ncbi:MAG: hypothetical protein Q9M39_07455 [Sulfurovum sp.]|nr:hypothetical protein [Sulfurovum sp.]